jgi:hypothetical protein
VIEQASDRSLKLHRTTTPIANCAYCVSVTDSL